MSTETVDEVEPGQDGPKDLGVEPGRLWVKILLGIAVFGLVAMWVYAFGFASKEAVNRVDDRSWSQRAESICTVANEARNDLADERRIDDAGPDALAERADIVDKATLILEDMLDDVVAVRPTGVDDKSLVDTWETFYRQLIVDRRNYTETLRAGENVPFAETAQEGAPISEWINDFTVSNEMVECSAPLDLSV